MLPVRLPSSDPTRYREPPPVNVGEPLPAIDGTLRAWPRSPPGRGRRAHQDREARTDAKLRLAGLALRRQRTVAHPVPAHGLPDPQERQAGPEGPAMLRRLHLSAGVGPPSQRRSASSPPVVTPTGVPAADHATILLLVQPALVQKSSRAGSISVSPTGCALTQSGRHSSHVESLTSRPHWRSHQSTGRDRPSDLSVLARLMCSEPAIPARSSRTPLTSSLRLSPTITVPGRAARVPQR